MFYDYGYVLATTLANISCRCSSFILWFWNSYFNASKVSYICLVTLLRLFITIRISGTTSTLVFSISTPLIKCQHFLVSSSLPRCSMTVSFCLFSSSISINFYISAYASYYRCLYRIATFKSIYYCDKSLLTLPSIYDDWALVF